MSTVPTTAKETATVFRPTTRQVLSALWLFVILNYAYCDVLALHDPEYLRSVISGDVGGMDMNQGFVLAASILMTIPMSSVLVVRVAPRRLARWWSIVAGAVMTLVQVGTLGMGTSPTLSYLYFSVIEVATTVAITWIATRHFAAERDTAQVRSEM